MCVGSGLLQISFIQSVDIADTFLVTLFRYNILLKRIQRQSVVSANEYKQKYFVTFHVCVYFKKKENFDKYQYILITYLIKIF